MHVVDLASPVTSARWKLAPGQYLCEDLSAFELAIEAERGTTQLEFFAPSTTASADEILLVSNGGYGDMLMLTAGLRKFADKYPDRKITLSCREKVHCIFDGMPYAPTLIDYPVPYTEYRKFWNILTTEHVQEASEAGKTTPAVDLKAQLLGVGPLEGHERQIGYVLKAAETQAMLAKYPKTGRPRIGVQLVSSSPTRNYHKSLMGEVMTALYDKGFEMLLFSTPGSLPLDAIPANKRDQITNVTVDGGLTFRETAALASTCDCLFTPDSALMHIAGALDIPCVSIFGSTHWKMRTADYSTVLAIQSNMGCPIAPCWHHPRGHLIFPAGQLCASKGYCGPLNAISPDQIVQKIQKQLTKYYT